MRAANEKTLNTLDVAKKIFRAKFWFKFDEKTLNENEQKIGGTLFVKLKAPKIKVDWEHRNGWGNGNGRVIEIFVISWLHSGWQLEFLSVPISSLGWQAALQNLHPPVILVL